MTTSANDFLIKFSFFHIIVLRAFASYIDGFPCSKYNSNSIFLFYEFNCNSISFFKYLLWFWVRITTMIYESTIRSNECCINHLILLHCEHVNWTEAVFDVFCIANICEQLPNNFSAVFTQIWVCVLHWDAE